jgi:hypothetical protein
MLMGGSVGKRAPPRRHHDNKCLPENQVSMASASEFWNPSRCATETLVSAHTLG